MSPGISRSQYFFLSLRTSLPPQRFHRTALDPFYVTLSPSRGQRCFSARRLPPLTTRSLFFPLAPTHTTVQVHLLLCNIYIYISFLYITLGTYIYSSARTRRCMYGNVKSACVTRGLIFF
jgi:hypothetical protein